MDKVSKCNWFKRSDLRTAQVEVLLCRENTLFHSFLQLINYLDIFPFLPYCLSWYFSKPSVCRKKLKSPPWVKLEKDSHVDESLLSWLIFFLITAVLQVEKDGASWRMVLSVGVCCSSAFPPWCWKMGFLLDIIWFKKIFFKKRREHK